MIAQLRLDLLQLGVRELVANALPENSEVLWEAQAPSRSASPDLPSVMLRVLSGPAPVHRGRAHGRAVELPSSATIVITTATVGERYFARVNGVDYFTDGIAADTVTKIRDRLSNTMQTATGGTAPFVDAIDSATDSIVLTPATPGALWGLEISGPLTASAGGLANYTLTESTYRVGVGVQVFSRQVSPRDGAAFHMGNILAAFEQPSNVALLSARGVAVWQRGSIIPLNSLVASSSWESRSALDVDFALRSVAVAPVGQIDQTTITVQASLVPGGAVVVTDTVQIP